MSQITKLLVIFGLLVFTALGQDMKYSNELANFRHNCSTPDLAGTILTSPCRETCSPCFSFYVSAIDLNKCIGYDGQDTLTPKKVGNYGNACTHCYTNWEEPDILHCHCNGNDGKTHDASLDLNSAVGTRCGRLSCQGYTHDLGPPLASPDGDNCEVQTSIPSGIKRAPKPTAAPELLYIRRGMVYRQIPFNVTASTTSAGTVSVIITLTAEPVVATRMVVEKPEVKVGATTIPTLLTLPSQGVPPAHSSTMPRVFTHPRPTHSPLMTAIVSVRAEVKAEDHKVPRSFLSTLHSDSTRQSELTQNSEAGLTSPSNPVSIFTFTYPSSISSGMVVTYTYTPRPSSTHNSLTTSHGRPSLESTSTITRSVDNLYTHPPTMTTIPGDVEVAADALVEGKVPPSTARSPIMTAIE